jgi:hypothetical protein
METTTDKGTETRDELASTRARGMRAIETEARAREAVAERCGRLADAALYREIGDRAGAVAAREAELGYARRTAAEGAQLRAHYLTRVRRVDRWLISCAMAVVVTSAALFLLTGCATGPDSAPGRVGVEAGIGTGYPSARGGSDVGDAGPHPVLELGGTFADRDGLSGARGEWFLQAGAMDSEVDAGELGTFELDAKNYRAGLGLRLGTISYLGLDWSAGLGACLTSVSGEASVLESPNYDFSESGVGAYCSGAVGRGPLYLGVRYVFGPSVDVEGEDVQLGGLAVVGGVRWSL